jgi:hypothetical protein
MYEIYYTIFCVQRFQVNSAVYVHMTVRLLINIYVMTRLTPLQGQVNFFHYEHHLKVDTYHSK